MNQLITALVAEGPRLNQRVLADMYADPFWEVRYGAQGRLHSRNDGVFHVKYLVSALQGDDPALFVTYARWLRDLLVARGMCSRHLADHFERLADAIDAEPWPDRSRATSILRRGAASLAHTDGVAGLVEARRDVLADALAEGGPAQLRADVVHLLSYLADALASGSRGALDGFVAYLRGAHSASAVERLLDRVADDEALPASMRMVARSARTVSP